jgi:hypothetical protein
MLKLGDCDKYDSSISSASNYEGAITDIRFFRTTVLRDYSCLRNALQEYVLSGEED